MAYTLANRATELLKELKRSDWIPKYNEDGINTVFEEMDRLMETMLVMFEKMSAVATEFEGDEVEANNEENEDMVNGLNTMLNIHHCTFYHDKRCLYAYLKHRLNKLREYRWDKGHLNTPEAQNVMSKGEAKYFQDYNQLLSTYMDGCGFDLTANMYPPRSLYVEVVALQDYGEIVTTSGTVNISFLSYYSSSSCSFPSHHLEKNSIHYLRLSDVEYLIRQGVLEVKRTN